MGREEDKMIIVRTGGKEKRERKYIKRDNLREPEKGEKKIEAEKNGED